MIRYCALAFAMRSIHEYNWLGLFEWGKKVNAYSEKTKEKRRTFPYAIYNLGEGNQETKQVKKNSKTLGFNVSNWMVIHTRPNATWIDLQG